MPDDVREVRCETCAFFQPSIPEGPEGDCHANPPTSYPAGREGGGIAFLTVWPRVQATDFCGCWEGKEEPSG